MTEIRLSCESIQAMQAQLDEMEANYKNPYSFTDWMYQPLDAPCFDYDREFVRLREYHETHWDQLPLLLTHKVRKGSASPRFAPMEFETIDEAKAIAEENYSLDFHFRRQGYEYEWNGVRIFLEDIEGLGPSIELIGSDKSLDELRSQLSLGEKHLYSVAKQVQLSLTTSFEQ